MSVEVKKAKYYEMAVALKPLLPDDVRKAIHKDFVDLVKGMGGEVLDVDVWGKRYLSFKIAGHNEGYYLVYNYSIAPKHIEEIKRQLQLKQEILRSMIVEVDFPEEIGTQIKKKEINI